MSGGGHRAVNWESCDIEVSLVTWLLDAIFGPNAEQPDGQTSMAPCIHPCVFSDTKWLIIASCRNSLKSIVIVVMTSGGYRPHCLIMKKYTKFVFVKNYTECLSKNCAAVMLSIPASIKKS